MERHHAARSITDQELIDRLARLTSNSRCTEADLVADIGEFDHRKLYARQACPSTFSYCTDVFHLSEPEAYLRITAARASRKHPILLTLLADGRLHLSGIALLARHLTAENRDVVLARASHRSKREIEELVAELSPRPDAPAVMRKLPDRRIEANAIEFPPANSDRVSRTEGALESGTFAPSDGLRPDGVPRRSLAAPCALRSTVEPLAPTRYKVQFTASASLHAKLERLQALLRSQVSDGDVGAIIEQAVTEKLERLEARRFGVTRAPRKALADTDTSASSRHIPAAVRRFVTKRDGMRCRYVDDQGRRCSERHRLEFHHRHPFGFGGDHRPSEVRLMCKAHNLLLAEHDYGRSVIAGHRSAARNPEARPPTAIR
jgi:hypothetical protein